MSDNNIPIRPGFGDSKKVTYPKPDDVQPQPQIPTRQVSQPIQQNFVQQNTNKQLAIDSKMDDAQIKLIPFVEKQIELMNNKLLFKGATPSFDELSEHLCKYEGVLLGLTSLYEMKRWDAEAAKEAYDEWFACHFIEVRDLVNPKDVAASKWYSAKEIEYIVISRYKEERAELLARMQLAEAERSTLERLIEGWKSYNYILSNLSANARAEAQASGVGMDLKGLDETD